MAARLAADQETELTFYGIDGAMLILATWDEESESEHPALESEVLAKYFALKGGFS